VKKRLRKKLRLGEFQELGFEVFFRVANNTPDDTFDRVIDAFITHAIEENGLMCGGGGKNPEWNVFVTLDRRGSAIDEHRQAVRKWLETCPEVKEIRLGPLVDAWYPKSKQN
jgi:hypothetical protein